MPRRRVRRRSRFTALALSAVLVGLAPTLALADGDPASDILTTQRSFVPIDTGTPRTEARLDAVLAAAAHAGYPLRVAVIASPSDLGSVSALWRQPAQYAQFLEAELSGVAPGRVLVVMPGGLYGLVQPGVSEVDDEALLHRTPAPPSNPDLAIVATNAVQLLAASSGHPIPSASIVTPPVVIPKTASNTPLSALVLAAGAVLLAGAWTLSLRARPLRRAGVAS